MTAHRSWARRVTRASASALSALLLTLTAVHPVQAQPGPIKVIVPYPAGGVTDLAARVLTERMARTLQQTIIIENVAGAGSRIGTVSAMQAKPDGSTLLFTNISYSTLPLVDPGFRQSPLTAFAPVGLAATYGAILVVHPSLPVRTLTELVEYARRHPGQLSYGSAGIGSGSHFAGEYLKALTGTDIIHVPYKSTTAALNDLIGGRISMGIDATVKPYIDSGKLRALAIVGSQRDARLPAVPIADQAGVPGLDMDAWLGMMAPVGTPPATLKALNGALNAALGDPAVKEQFASLGLNLQQGGPELLTQQLQKDAALYKSIVDKANLRFE